MASNKFLKDVIYTDYFLKGNLSVGVKLPTVRALAEQYDVSTPTLSRAIDILASEGWVSKKSRSGLYVAKLPNYMDKTSSQKQLKIGFISIGFSPLSPLQPIDGILQMVRSHNGILEMANTRWDIDEERRQIDMMCHRGVQGFVLYPTVYRGESEEYLAKDFRDFPVVVLDLYQPTMNRSHVIFDNVSAGRDMTRYLLLKGHKNIVFIKFEDSYKFPSLDDRITGYRQALKEVGNMAGPELILRFDARMGVMQGFPLTDYISHRKFYDVCKQILEMNPRPTAIITPSDYFASLAVRYLRSQKIAVPEEILICGFDNLPERRCEGWPTTSPDFYRMGERAAEMLITQIENRDQTVSETILSSPVVISEGEALDEYSDYQMQKNLAI